MYLIASICAAEKGMRVSTSKAVNCARTQPHRSHSSGARGCRIVVQPASVGVQQSPAVGVRATARSQSSPGGSASMSAKRSSARCVAAADGGRSVRPRDAADDHCRDGEGGRVELEAADPGGVDISGQRGIGRERARKNKGKKKRKKAR